MTLHSKALRDKSANTSGARPGRRRWPTAALGVPATLCLVTVAACGGASTPRPAVRHGDVVAHLSIPYAPRPGTGKTQVIPVTVTVGERFSIKVDTSDGPYDWSQTGTGPDPSLVRLVGNFNDGSCAPELVGCRVPYFHTLVARGKGTTMMSWAFHAFRCSVQPKAAGMRAYCAALPVVTFDIRIT
jgi:hypothetical protein